MPQPSTVPVKNAEPAEKIAPIDDWNQKIEQDATDTSHRGQPFVLAARRGRLVVVKTIWAESSS